MHRLLLRFDDGPQIRVRAERFVIGRSPNADVVISSSELSRHHLYITFHDGHPFCEDIGANTSAVRRVRDGHSARFCELTSEIQEGRGAQIRDQDVLVIGPHRVTCSVQSVG